MTIWIKSQGIMTRQKLVEACLGQSLARITDKTSFATNDKLAGWGLKANTDKIKRQASQFSAPYLHLEDGFIGYIGHPAKQGHAVSLISDAKGIYYDARQPCDLESLIKVPLTEVQLTRSHSLMQSMVASGITKYNIYNAVELPEALKLKLAQIKQKKILIVDQVAGDLSITGALADENSFVVMVAQAKKNHPNAKLLLRTHPDTRLGKKKGVLAKLWTQCGLATADCDIEIVNEHCHPHALINAVDAVYTVSSQMGFEALLLNKPVYCFGIPFYAGWGLTTDAFTCERRESVSLAQLFYAALIKYCHYYHPVLQTKCEIEEVMTLIGLQNKSKTQWHRLYLVGFSMWKRAFMKHFCRHLANEIVFVKRPPHHLNNNDKLLVWGAKYPELTNCLRVEDGFIRSNGLGANLCRPSSLSIDQAGIYFDNRTPSDLENDFNDAVLSISDLTRARTLIKTISESGVSKYNVGEKSSVVLNNQNSQNDKNKNILLVVGQVDGDASLITGSLNIQNNEAETIIHLSLTSLYPHINELHTMTSLSGFEALLNNVTVHAWGQPFYAGWGLTTDYYPPKRRHRTRTLPELVFITLIKYPLYIDWDTGLWITPELLIEKMANIENQDIKKQSYFNRKLLKLKYIFEMLCSTSY